MLQGVYASQTPYGLYRVHYAPRGAYAGGGAIGALDPVARAGAAAPATLLRAEQAKPQSAAPPMGLQGTEAAKPAMLPVQVTIPDAANNYYTAAELAVRMRMRPFEGAAMAPHSAAAAEEGLKAGSMEELENNTECQTCRERRYQDESNDPSVSFQNPQSIHPSMVASTVRAHEMEHVHHERAKAQQEDRKVVSQSVVLHSAICPECGETYTSGGTTRTVTKANSQAAPLGQVLAEDAGGRETKQADRKGAA